MNVLLRIVGYLVFGMGLVLSTTYAILQGIDPEIVAQKASMVDVIMGLVFIFLGGLAISLGDI